MFDSLRNWLGREKASRPARGVGISCMGIESKEELRRTLEHIARAEGEKKAERAAAEGKKVG